ncbi:MAG: hypothetical protein PHC30_01395 [Lentisphaeria bacterium]|nr:hypothetical protein [Lentisphaeria bacterium]
MCNNITRSLLLTLTLLGTARLQAAFPGPFRAEALAFYFAHDGGPLQLQATIIGDQAAAVVRVFDAQEGLRLWQYCRPQPGGHTLNCDFGADAPAGIYQLRVSGKDYQIDPQATPAKPFGVMAASCRLHATTPDQFAETFFMLPHNAEKFSWSALGCKHEILDGDGAPVVLPENRQPMEVSAHRGEVWSGRFTIPPGNYSALGFEHLPVILCPDRETARRINASLEQTEDGHYYPHQFQLRIHAWLEKQKTADLAVPIVDLRQFSEHFAAEENHQALLGHWGIFTYINHVLENQDTDPDSEKFGANGNTTMLAVVNSLDKPFNPYFGKLEKRLLIPALRRLLAIQENDSFRETASNYSGAWAMNYLSMAQQLAEGHHQVRDQEALNLWRDGARRVADRFSMFRVSCENQSSHWPLSYYYLYQGIGEPGYRQLAADFMVNFCRPEHNRFMQTGYQQEAYGPDASYQGLGACLQAAYYRLSNDPVARDGLQRIFHFFNHTIVPEPDGRKVGATNFSHRTKGSWARAQYGAGIPLLQGILPEAACLARTKTDDQPSLEELLTPPTDVYRPAIGYATASFGPFFNAYRFASKPLPDAQLPVLAENNFTRNFNHEFLAWRRPGFYAFAYTGKTADAWTKSRARKFPENPADEKASNGWFQTQGLSILWFEKYGAFILGKNWNAFTGQFLRGELPDGRCAYPDYWEHQNERTEERLRLQSKLFQAEACRFTRDLSLLPDGLRQTLIVDFDEDCAFTALYDQLPILLKGDEPAIEFQVDGVWQRTPGRCQAVRVNNLVTITFAQPQTCSLGPETELYGQRLACLQIHLGAAFKAGDTVSLAYDITGE